MKLHRIIPSILLAFVILISPVLALDLEAGTGEDFYVQDNANVLSEATKAEIVSYNETLETQCSNAQLVVVTVNYLDEDSDVAALQLMNDWGVGSAENSNGMLLLLVAQEYRGWLATGDGIRNVFTDYTADEYLNEYFWDYIDNDEFDKGVSSLCEELFNWHLEYYGVISNFEYSQGDYSHEEVLYPGEYEYYEPYDDYYIYEREVSFMNLFTVLVILVVLWALIASSRYRRMRGWGYTGSFWPIFWFGGPRIYRDWHHRHPGPRPGPGPHHGPHPGPGPHSGPRPGPGPHSAPHSGPRPGPGPHSSRPSGPRPGSSSGFNSHGGAGRSSGSFGGGHHGGSSHHGGGFGGHGGGGGGGRR